CWCARRLELGATLARCPIGSVQIFRISRRAGRRRAIGSTPTSLATLVIPIRQKQRKAALAKAMRRRRCQAWGRTPVGPRLSGSVDAPRDGRWCRRYLVEAALGRLADSSLLAF